MRISVLCFLATAQLAVSTATGAFSQGATADSCYYIPLPQVPVSDGNRTVPWGKPTIQYPNGTTCCSSIDQVRAGIDDINVQLLQLLSMRTAYVGEAARFKGTAADVNVPSRIQRIIQRAIDDAPAVHLPQIVAQMVFKTIIDASMLFEDCIFNTYEYTIADEDLGLVDQSQ